MDFCLRGPVSLAPPSAITVSSLSCNLSTHKLLHFFEVLIIFFLSLKMCLRSLQRNVCNVDSGDIPNGCNEALRSHRSVSFTEGNKTLGDQENLVPDEFRISSHGHLLSCFGNSHFSNAYHLG